MPYNPPDYIDNAVAERMLATVLDKIIRELGQTRADFASGFFNPKVWLYLRDALLQLDQFRLLLGKQPDTEYGGMDTLDLRQYFRQKLRGEIEEMPFDVAHARMIDELMDFLRKPQVQVRLYREKFLHAKAYIFPNWSIVGSSNFTPHGLTENSELNMLRYGEHEANQLRNWFQGKWEETVAKEEEIYERLRQEEGKEYYSYKDELLEILEESKFGGRPYSPYHVFIKALYEWLKERLGLDKPDTVLGVELASFQKEGLQEAIHILEKHHGVIVSDAVGLGKTYIAMGILEYYLGKRRPGRIPRALVICPAQLRDLMWEAKLDEYGIKAKICSQEEIARDDFPWRHYNNYDLIVVDESHNFRNPGTKRYTKLSKIISTGKQGKRVILLTATPINNSIYDLYNQMMLLTRGRDGYFRDYGIHNLYGFFKRVDKGAAELFDLLEETTVRRSRFDIKRRQKAGERMELPGKGEIHFPDRELRIIKYNLEETYNGFYKAVADSVERLKLAVYNVEYYKKEADEDVVRRNDALIGIMRTRFLKRIESSLKAFEISVTNQQKYTRSFFEFLQQDKLLDSPTHRKILALEDEETDLTIEEIIKDLPEVDSRDYDLEKLETDITHDIDILDSLLEKLSEIRGKIGPDTAIDRKLIEFKRVLADELKSKKVLIFSYYKDTANYIYKSLTEDETWQRAAGQPQIDIITGETGPKDRETRVKRFAPIANTKEDEEGLEERLYLQQNALDILISTDVLSEGQNLQDAGIVINYDLHWNPVRMIQRAGRVDRLGSDYDQILIYNCFPEEGLEELLGLVRRLQQRISDIDRTVGLDASVLGEVIQDKSLEQLKRIKQLDKKVVEDLEQAFEMVSLDEMKYPLILAINQLGEEKIKEIPMGIHSWKGAEVGGIFIALRAGDRHYWRVYPADGSEVITEKRKIFNWIQSADQKIPSRIDRLPYEMVERAVNEVLEEIAKQRRGARIAEPLKGLNKKLYDIINDYTLFDEIEAELRERLNNVLAYHSLRTFQRDPELKDILEVYKTTNDAKRLAERLDEYFVENDLYREIEHPTTLEQIKREDVQLVCYEVLKRV